MEKKDTIIHCMEQMLEFERELPIFKVCFKVQVTNDNIEKYLLEHTDTTDWNGHTLDEDYIAQLKTKKIENFRNSKGYNTKWHSYIEMSKTMTYSDIQFDKVKRLVCGEEDNMPEGYEFIGDFSLFKMEDYVQ